ncbi:MAG TPA: hypothetical protein VNA14_01945 [Mycobacteriales bacterium]|nr:hypothetical protein [Mycobacteriales bacterium]
MRSIPRLAAAALALGAVIPMASAADAATAPVKAAGVSQSTAELIQISAFGKTVALGSLSSNASTLAALDALVEFTPVTVDGVKSGTQTVTPASSPKTVPAMSTTAVGALPASLLSITSPAADLAASVANAAPTAGLTGNLGSVRLLGADLLGSSGVQVGSAVNSVGSSAGKSLSLNDVGLPSIGDVLAGLGLDLSALPLPVVRDLLRSLPGTLAPAIEAAMTAAQSAQTTVDAAQAQLTAATSQAAPLQAAAAAATTALQQANAAVVAAQAQLNLVNSLPVPVPADVASATAALSSAQAAATSAATTLSNANAAVAAANAAVDAAQAALNAALAALNSVLDTVLAAAAAVLDTPLASIDAVTVATRAKVGPKAADQVATVTGTISGVEVLGADVLSLAGLGSTVDLVSTANAVVSQINAQAGSILGAVFGTLNGAVPGLTVPAPSVEFLTQRTETGMDGAFGTAYAAVNALTVRLGAITIPTLVALPTLPALPGITQAAGSISTAPIEMIVGQLGENARFRPASLSGAPITPGVNGAPSLPRTGAPVGLAITALIVTGLAAVARRRSADQIA